MSPPKRVTSSNAKTPAAEARGVAKAAARATAKLQTATGRKPQRGRKPVVLLFFILGGVVLRLAKDLSGLFRPTSRGRGQHQRCQLESRGHYFRLTCWYY